MGGRFLRLFVAMCFLIYFLWGVKVSLFFLFSFFGRAGGGGGLFFLLFGRGGGGKVSSFIFFGGEGKNLVFPFWWKNLSTSGLLPFFSFCLGKGPPFNSASQKGPFVPWKSIGSLREGFQVAQLPSGFGSLFNCLWEGFPEKPKQPRKDAFFLG